MTRPAVLPAAPADVEVRSFSNPWTRLWPLWRHAAWFGVLFAAMATFVAVRVDVKQATADLHRNERLLREAQIDGERLALEMATRRRAVALEAQADAMTLALQVPVRAAGAAPAVAPVATPVAALDIASGAP